MVIARLARIEITSLREKERTRVEGRKGERERARARCGIEIAGSVLWRKSFDRSWHLLSRPYRRSADQDSKQGPRMKSRARAAGITRRNRWNEDEDSGPASRRLEFLRHFYDPHRLVKTRIELYCPFH